MCTVGPQFTASLEEYLIVYVKRSLRCFEYSKPSIIRHSIIRQLWSSATNLPGHFAITPASKLP